MLADSVRGCVDGLSPMAKPRSDLGRTLNELVTEFARVTCQMAPTDRSATDPAGGRSAGRMTDRPTGAPSDGSFALRRRNWFADSENLDQRSNSIGRVFSPRIISIRVALVRSESAEISVRPQIDFCRRLLNSICWPSGTRNMGARELWCCRYAAGVSTFQLHPSPPPVSPCCR